MSELTVYRLVQEALTNVAKYARASNVTVTLAPEARDRVRVTVEDDGVGFDTGIARIASHGLIGMRYRVEAEGGSMRLRSAPGEGTLVEAILPALSAPDGVAVRDEEPQTTPAAA